MFDFTSVIRVVSNSSRFPFVCLCDGLCVCFYSRRYFTFFHPFASLIFCLFLSTFVDNYASVMDEKKLAVFNHNYLVLLSLVIWLGFNFSPRDIVYKKSNQLWPLFEILTGYLIGRDVTLSVDIGMQVYQKSRFWILITSINISSAKYVIMALYGNYKRQKYRPLIPYFIQIIIATFCYYVFCVLLIQWRDSIRTLVVCVTTASNLALAHVDDRLWIKVEHFLAYGMTNVSGNQRDATRPKTKLQ